MGQYYHTILGDPENTFYEAFNLHVNGVFTGLKLMEHSWWDNPFVNSICKRIFITPTRVAWVGDYSGEEEVSKKYLLHEICWGDNAVLEDIKEDQLKLDGLFLINHTKKEYLDCSKYKKASTAKDCWIIHPLPLLTAVGNGLGGGDYDGVNEGEVGRWCYDVLEISADLTPYKEYAEISVYFKE